MKKWLVIFLCIIVAYGFWRISTYLFSIHEERQRILQRHTELHREAAARAYDASEDIWHRLMTARTLEAWEELLKTDISGLPEMEQQRVHMVIKSKLFEILFWQAETLLARARGFLEQDENNIMAGVYIEKARIIYERVKEFMPDIGEIQGDLLWNMRLHYLKGVYYFRISSLIFMKKIQEQRSKVEDVVAQSVTSFDKALVYAPKDHDTQVAIEVLQKKVKNTFSSSGTVDNKRLELQLLPGKDKEVGPFQVGPREEGKY
ncbi:MAG: hypothetical protein AAB972_05295 [Patescibacteria group bacterium]